MDISERLTFDRGKTLFLPAHSRGNALPFELKRLLKCPPGQWDLPELPDIGTPLASSGAIFESQKKFADLLNVDRCWFGVNGATGLLQAALFSIANPQQSVLMPRNIHTSLIKACLLRGLKPILFDLPFLCDRGHLQPPNESLLKKVLKEVDKEGIDIGAVVLVHPTYHGYSDDISTLISQLHIRGLPVLVDEAHGTYFSFVLDQELPKSSLVAGADLVVHSLHKSAPGLTQTAVLWSQGNLVDPFKVEKSLSLVQTTSPNALLISSCEAVLNHLFSKKGKKQISNRLNQAREIYWQLLKLGLPFLETQDPLKLILHTASIGINGLEADSWLISRGVVAELPEPGTLTFCMGFSSQKGLVQLMNKTWKNLIASDLPRETFPDFRKPPVPFLLTPSILLADAWLSKSKSIPLKESIGKVSAELISPYPPGIPMLLPGEVLDQTRVEWLIEQQNLWPEAFSSQIKVMA